MSTAPEKMTEPFPSGGGGWSARDVLVWLPCCLLLGLLAARATVDARTCFSPLLLFPLLIGTLLGALLVLLMRMAQVGHRPTIIAGTLLAACMAAVGVRFQTSPLQGGYDRLLWIAEGLVLTAAALAVVIPGMYFHFCRRCHSWYRTVRSARLPAAAIGELAGLLNVDIPHELRSGRCRLLACLGGCGPTGCELAWEDRSGQTAFARVWLLPEQRYGVVRIFDRYTQEN
jgi:hypothetical protein